MLCLLFFLHTLNTYVCQRKPRVEQNNYPWPSMLFSSRLGLVSIMRPF